MLHDCKAMTKTVPPSTNTEECTLHIAVTHDYRFKSLHRDQIMDVIKRAYFNQNEVNVSVYCVSDKDLKQYTQTKNETESGTNKIPPDSNRRPAEDLFETREQEHESIVEVLTVT